MESLPTPRAFCEIARSIESRMPWKLRKKREAHHQIQELKLRLLEHVIAVDPTPGDFERVLVEAASEEPVDGPARGVVTDIMLDWQMVRTNPRTMLWMIGEATAPPEQRRRPRRDVSAHADAANIGPDEASAED